MILLEILFLLTVFSSGNGHSSEEEPVLYYYGIGESERGLPACSARQACSALLQRYWRPGALVRLCRCSRRQRCDTPAPVDHRIELNNRAYLQFCQPITNWPYCAAGKTALTIDTSYDRINPDELEELHHKNIQLIPPKINFLCQCRTPNYWRLTSESTNQSSVLNYRCSSLPVCRTGELCGNVSNDLFALYQSCLCPRRHICVHSGGISRQYISEVLYSGIGWRAHCQNNNDIDHIDSYENY